MKVAQQQKQQLPAFDAMRWMQSWEQLGHTFSGMAAVKSIQPDEFIEMDSYSAYEEGRLSEPSSENMPEVTINIDSVWQYH